MNRREEILEKIKSVPAVPAAAVEVTTMLRNPDVDFNHVDRIIKHDQGLTANVLKMANSAYYKGTSEIKSVKNAVIRMGANSVLQMVMVSAVGPLVSREVKGYGLPQGALWEHSVATAICSRELARSIDVKAPDDTFTIGILADIGKLVMGTFIEIDGIPIMEMAVNENVSFEVAEREILGIDHAETGAELLKCWNFPESLVEPVRWHHEPDNCEIGREAADLVHIADAFVTMAAIGTGNDGLHYLPSENSAERLGLQSETCEQVIKNLVEALEDARGIINLTM